MRASEGKTQTRPRRRLALTERDHQIAEATRRFEILSRDQYIALEFFQSVTRANTRLLALVEAQVLQRKSMPVYPHCGSAQSHYFIDKGSAALLEVDPAVIAQQIRQISRRELRQVEHQRSANQIMVDFLGVLRHAPDASLIGFHTEPELRRILLNRGLVPDGWVAWKAAVKRFNCFVEVDLHHEGLTVWRNKILQYLGYAESGRHEELFGFHSFRVLVLAKSAPRLNNLRQVAIPAGRLFLFTDLNGINRANLLSPIWLPATGSRPLTLTEA